MKLKIVFFYVLLVCPGAFSAKQRDPRIFFLTPGTIFETIHEDNYPLTVEAGKGYVSVSNKKVISGDIDFVDIDKGRDHVAVLMATPAETNVFGSRGHTNIYDPFVVLVTKDQVRTIDLPRASPTLKVPYKETWDDADYLPTRPALRTWELEGGRVLIGVWGASVPSKRIRGYMSGSLPGSLIIVGKDESEPNVVLRFPSAAWDRKRDKRPTNDFYTFEPPLKDLNKAVERHAKQPGQPLTFRLANILSKRGFFNNETEAIPSHTIAEGAFLNRSCQNTVAHLGAEE